jgi:integrase
MAMSTDRLRSRKSLSTYADILNRYFEFIGELRHFEKLTAERFIFNKKFSPFTSALYATVLKSFARWAVGYLISPDSELSSPERKIKQALSDISIKSLRDILAIKTKAVSTKLYHKESFSKAQREQLMKLCNTEAKAIVSLMAYNGLRPIEVERLDVADVNFKKFILSDHGKGRSHRLKDEIVLFKIVARCIRAYLKQNKIKKGKLFPYLTYKSLHEMIRNLFSKMRLTKTKDAMLSPHSLRHTAGQLLYDDGVPLEFIQRTLRHTSMESTLVYARKAIERNYFKQMRHHW